MDSKQIVSNIIFSLHVTKRGLTGLHPPPGMPDYDDLCDELTYDELTDGLSTCSGSVNDLLDQLGVEETEISEEASFQEDLDADSLDLVELIMELEDHSRGLQEQLGEGEDA